MRKDRDASLKSVTSHHSQEADIISVCNGILATAHSTADKNHHQEKNFY